MSLKEETMNNLIAEIEKYSDFNEADKNIWKKRIEIISPEYALFLLDIFKNSPKEVAWLNQNIKEKERILASRDEGAWQKLLEEEKKHLQNIN